MAGGPALDKVLIDTDAIETQVGIPLAETLKEQMKGLTAGVGRAFNALNEVKDLISKANQAGDDVLDVSDISGMQAELGQLDYNVTQATAAMTRVAPGLRQEAQSRIDGVIDDALADSGEGTEVLVWALDMAAQEMAKLAKEAAAKRTVQEQGLEGITNPNGELATAREDLQKAWTAFLPLRHKEKKDAAAAYGEVAVQYAGKIVDVQTAAVAETVLAAARDSLIAAHSEVRAAERTLRGMFTRAQDLWRSDELAGKDAGVPGQTLFLVPSDVLPQVEDSALALAGWERVLRQLKDDPALARSKAGGRDWLRAFHRDLRLLGHNRGIRAIGSKTDAKAQERAREQFSDQLATLAERLSEPLVSLPSDLVAAAGQADAIASGREYDAGVTNGAETQRLQLALTQIGQKALMPLNFELGRARFQGAETVDPPVLVIASAAPLTSELINRLPTPPNRHVPSGDPERVALTAVLSGLTIGMVLGLDDWYYSYQRVMENRAIRREKANQPPPHLKRSMRRATTEPLVRRAYRESQVADLVVRAFALPDSDVLPLIAEDVNAGNETIRQVVGLRVEVRDGQIVAIGAPWVLGTTLVEWFDAVGRESRLHTAIDVSWGHVHRQAFQMEARGDASLVEALRERAADWLEFNDEEWTRLRDLAGATAETAAEAAIRGSLVVAGRKLLTEALERHAPRKRHVGA